jgi:excisionase family DNA binding protein
MDDRLLYRVVEVAHYLSVSKSKVYELMRSGALPSVRIDGARRVRGEDVRAFVDSLARAA